MESKKGIVYMHEHMTIDLSGVKKDLDCRLDTMEETIEELKGLKLRGVASILDVTNRGMGRNIEYVQKVQQETGIRIVSSTGYYKEPFLPEEVYIYSEKELVSIMIKEIEIGIEDSGVKAEVIGEVGTGKGTMSEVEKKLMICAAYAQAETGRPITTHTTLGGLGIEQANLLKTYGADLNNVIIGHVDLSGDYDYALRLIDMGVYVGFDTIGKINYMPEERRLEMLREICSRGMSSRVIMSMDITRKTHLKSRGGLGYSYLLDTFVPYIKENGIKPEDIDNMLVLNPQRILDRK